jgi:predicted  nucleic acid-binding Zn-ribbon protein
MSSGTGVIEREDLERLTRLTSGIGALLETRTNIQLAEESLASHDRYKDRFLTLSELVTDCASRHRAQQQMVADLETRLKKNNSDFADTQMRVNAAVEKSDVETIAFLNGRLPAIRLMIDSLERKLVDARQELVNKWRLFDGARGQLGDIRRQVDGYSSRLEQLVAIAVHGNDPALEEIRARHSEMLNPKRGE